MSQIKELSNEEAESLAAKLPLPSFPSQDDEIYCAQQFVESHKKGIACIVLGLSDNTMRKQWRAHRRRWLESERFRAWCQSVSAKWDVQRGKYLAFYPENQ